jgi:hypothetical protein
LHAWLWRLDRYTLLYVVVIPSHSSGFINVILSWKGFIPLSKLCYVGYLIHPILIYIHRFTNARLLYVDVSNMVRNVGKEFTDNKIVFPYRSSPSRGSCS